MRINFDFVDLEVFLAVRETGSFHLASERLGMSQSSVSRRIQKLEAVLSTSLFERTTRLVKPTLAAKRFQIRAETLLSDARETASAMSDNSMRFAHQRAHTMTIAAIPTVIPALVIPAIQEARAEGFLNRIRILDLAANEVGEAVAQREADFGICSVPMLEPSTTFEVLFDDPMVLAVWPEHPFAELDQVPWSHLVDAELILPARGTGNRLLIDESMARARQPLRWVYEVSRTATALDLVANRIGVAPVPRSAIARQHNDRILGKPIVSPALARPIGLISRVDRQHNANEDTLLGIFRREGRGIEH